MPYAQFILLVVCLTTWLGILIPLICVIHQVCSFYRADSDRADSESKPNYLFFAVFLIVTCVAYVVFFKIYFDLPAQSYQPLLILILYSVVFFPFEFVSVLGKGFQNYDELIKTLILFFPVVLSLFYMIKSRKQSKMLFATALTFISAFGFLVLYYYLFLYGK